MRRWLTSSRSILSFALLVMLVFGAACTAGPQDGGLLEDSPADAGPLPSAAPTQSFQLPHNGSWKLPTDIPTGRLPAGQGTIIIEGLGEFTFNPLEIETVRPDVFAPGHFSIFDVLVDLSSKGWFTMEYHYEESLGTHIIDQLDGRMNWWYRAHYSSGWFELNAFRMDLYPYKDGTRILLQQQTDEFMGRLYSSFADEVRRRSLNQDRLVIPEVRIGPVVHTNVPVSAHDVRSDVLAPGTITALDVLLSLADQEKIDAMKLTWYGSIGDANPVDSFWVEQIDDGDDLFDNEASPETGGWVYETGARDFSGFQGSHIHVPADVRVLVSPEYMMWYWLGSSR
ncbi:MAG: hypothetical protein ACOC9B_05250 [Chloroflexota bacterium]